MIRAIASLLILCACCGCLGAVPASTQRATTQVDFLAAAREVTDYIQKNYWLADAGLYAHTFKDRSPETMWGNGVMFSALVAAAKHDPHIFRPIMSRFFVSMDRYWDAKATPPGYEPWPTKGNGHDKYYDDNEWMTLAFLEAYKLTREVRYLDRADDALKFALSGWDDRLGGGIWWHEGHKDGSKNACSNAPAAFACIRMAEFRRRDENIAWAHKIVAWVNAHLQDPDGLFWDRIDVATGKANHDKLTYNTALMLRANLELSRATHEQRYADEAARLDHASEWFVGTDGAYRDDVKWSHLQVEADLAFYNATGNSKSLVRARRNGEVAFAAWKEHAPGELIENAAIARMLWMLSEQKSDKAR